MLRHQAMERETKFMSDDEGSSILRGKHRTITRRKAASMETLDYDVIENQLLIDKEARTSRKQWQLIRMQRWLVCVIIGILTGIIAVAIELSIHTITHFKMAKLSDSIQYCANRGCLLQPMFMWIGFNAAFVMASSFITTYISPVAAGSGIPQIKCYLNGIKIPEVVRLKTLFTKVVGIILSVSGGLPVGKEGPMVHSGSVVAAGVSQGRSVTAGVGSPLFKQFRNDRERRDFVCAGAAAGVSAAFGAPVGGVLFSLEEAASFWHQALTWRIFLCSILSSYTLNYLGSLLHGHAGDLGNPGLINFGKFEGTYAPQDLIVFLLMGGIGGLGGAAFNALNIHLTKFRQKYIKTKILCIFEAGVIAGVCALVGFVLIYMNGECKPINQDSSMKLQFFCHDGEYNTMATLLFTTPESSVKSLFHDPPGAYSAGTLIVFVIPYFFLACVTYGLRVPSGLFIPSLLIGAAWGRLIGVFIHNMWPSDVWTHDLAKYSLMGAAAQLGGTVRMTISLTVILIEATGNISYSLPLMAVLLIAKFVGDMFNTGIYDMHIELGHIPILDWDPPALSHDVKVSDVMRSPAITLNMMCKVRDVIYNLTEPSRNHGGYPVKDTRGKFRGTILRSQLLVLLRNKSFCETSRGKRVPQSIFRDSYARFHTDTDPPPPVSVPEREMHLDLEPYLNCAPYIAQKDSSFPRVFRLFRALGLRHLVVVNDEYAVVGIVTRKDLFEAHRQRKHPRIPCH